MKPGDANLTYWAAEPDSRELVRRALQKFGRSLNTARKTQVLDKTRRMMMAYYGTGEAGRDTSRTRLGGKQGEITLTVHNGVRPLISQVLALVCGQRPGLKAVATNTDASSIAQTELAGGVREYYERTLAVPAVETDVVRGGHLASQFWAVVSWKRTKGEPYAVEGDKLIYEGGPELAVVPWWRVAADPLALRPQTRQWVLFKVPANRFDLAAEYEQAAESLLNPIEVAAEYDWKYKVEAADDFQALDVLFGDTLDAEEGCWLWELRHIPTAALPRGRIVRFVDANTVLFDSAAFDAQVEPQLDESGAPIPLADDAATQKMDVGYPYQGLHAHDYCPERYAGTTRGYTSSWDLLGLQELLDVCTISMATVVNLYGMPHLWAGPEGAAGINATVMSTGPAVLETKTEPKVLKFEALSNDVVEVSTATRDLMREAAALNKTVMGEPDKGMPASAQALQRAQAVQIHQTATGEYVRLVEDIATSLLQVSQRFAKQKQTAEIAGKSGGYEIREWQREDVAGVRRFAVEVVDPLTQSYEGRQAEAEFLAKLGWLSKQGYLAFKSTGSLKEPLEADKEKLQLLAEHKTLLRDGIGLPPVDVAATQAALAANPAAGPVFVADGAPAVRLSKYDPHWLTIPEYYSVLYSVTARENPKVVAAVAGVIQESMRLWASLTPDELAVMGGPALPSQLEASGAGAPPPSGEGPPPSGADVSKPDDGNPELPKPPEDPITQNQQGRESLALQ